jgi:hypothetical protein
MPNLYMVCTVVALFFSGLFYVSFPENLASIYGPSSDIDLVEKAYAQQRADVEIMQRRLLQDQLHDPTDTEEATAAGGPQYDCNNYNIAAINDNRFVKQLTGTGAIYTAFAGRRITYGIVDVAGGVINHLPQGELPEAIRTQLDGYLPTLDRCRHAPMDGVMHSHYLISAGLRDHLERNR